MLHHSSVRHFAGSWNNTEEALVTEHQLSLHATRKDIAESVKVPQVFLVVLRQCLCETTTFLGHFPLFAHRAMWLQIARMWNTYFQPSSNDSIIGVKGALLIPDDAGLDSRVDIGFDRNCSVHSWMLPTGPPTMVMLC